MAPLGPEDAQPRMRAVHTPVAWLSILQCSSRGPVGHCPLDPAGPQSTSVGPTVERAQDRIGSLEVGKELDALVLDTTNAAVFDVAPRDTLLDRVEKVVNLGDDRSVVQVFVQGRSVLPARGD